MSSADRCSEKCLCRVSGRGVFWASGAFFQYFMELFSHDCVKNDSVTRSLRKADYVRAVFSHKMLRR